MINLKTLMKSALVGAVVVATPLVVNASTITIFDLSGGDPSVIVADTGAITGSALAGSFASSGMTFSVVVTPTDNPGQSLLNTISVTTSGAGKIGILVSEDGFSGGAGAPSPSGLTFSLSATSVGFSVEGSGFVDDGNVLGAMIDAIGLPPIIFSTPFAGGLATGLLTDTAVLTGLFSMTSYFEVEHDAASDITSFDATTIAAVPLPAAGFLLIGALGGLGALSRRRKKAA